MFVIFLVICAALFAAVYYESPLPPQPPQKPIYRTVEKIVEKPVPVEKIVYVDRPEPSAPLLPPPKSDIIEVAPGMRFKLEE